MLMIHGDSDAVFLSGRHVRGSRDRLLGQARRVPIVIALVVYNLRPLPRDEEPETLEMLRMVFKPRLTGSSKRLPRALASRFSSATPTGLRCAAAASGSGREPAPRYPKSLWGVQ